MPVLIDRYQVFSPASLVSDFHFQPNALKLLTPPPVIIQLHAAQPLAEDSRSEFTLWFGPLPIRWRARHVRVSRDGGFTDVQERGPFHLWEHTHAWRADGPDSTEMVEIIQYRHRQGREGLLTRLLFSPPLLRLMFTHRRRTVQTACERQLRLLQISA